MKALIAAALACCIVVPAARADDPVRVVCDGVEPAQVSLRESGIDTPRSACGGSDASALARGITAIDTGSFYGTISGSFFLRGRWLTVAGLELEAGARVLDYRFAQNAVLTDDELSVGPVVIGVAGGEDVRWFDRAGRWGAQLRLEVPRTESGLAITALTASPGFVWTLEASERWRVHSRLAMLLRSARTSRAIDTRFAGLAGVDATARVGSSLGLSVGAEGQGGWHRGPLDHLLIRAGLAYGQATRATLSIGAPLFGDERANISVSIGLSRRR